MEGIEERAVRRGVEEDPPLNVGDGMDPSKVTTCFWMNKSGALMADWASKTTCCGLISRVAAIPASNSAKGIVAFDFVRTYFPNLSRAALKA